MLARYARDFGRDVWDECAAAFQLDGGVVTFFNIRRSLLDELGNIRRPK